jgi:hypothetical protein
MFEEQNAIGQIGQRIVVGHVSYSPLGHPTLGDVLVNGDPASARHRLIFDLNHTAVGEFLDLDAGISCRGRGKAIGDIFVNIARESAVGLAVDEEVAKCEARLDDVGGDPIHFEISAIADDHPRRCIKHDEGVGHVVNRRLKKLMLFAQLCLRLFDQPLVRSFESLVRRDPTRAASETPHSFSGGSADFSRSHDANMPCAALSFSIM